jgi:hypothetical protein
MPDGVDWLVRRWQRCRGHIEETLQRHPYSPVAYAVQQLRAGGALQGLVQGVAVGKRVQDGDPVVKLVTGMKVYNPEDQALLPS